MCRVFSCVVGRGYLLWPVRSLGKTLLVFDLLHSALQGQICLLLQVFLDIVQEAGIKSIPTKKKCKKANWLSEEALQIAVKRRESKSKGEKERYTHLNAEFQRIARRVRKPSSISLHWLLRKAFLSLLAVLWNSAFKWEYLSFSPLLFASLLFTAICKASPDSHFAFLHFFFLVDGLDYCLL